MLHFLSNYSNIIRSNIAAGFELINIKRNKGSKTQPWSSLDDDQDKLKERLRNCLAHIKNMNCSDCLKRGPMWASLTFGVFICFECSDFHRNLSGLNVCHTISVIKSVNLDDWTVSQVEFMEKFGNEQARKYYEASLPPDFIRPLTKDRKQFQQFIYEKYILLRYISSEINQIEILSNSLTNQVTSSSSLAITTTTTNSDDIYISERNGGELYQEVDKYIKKIGENRKVKKKETIGPLHSSIEELEKQSQKMKRQFELEDKKKQDQYIRGMMAMHEISTKKKQMNEINNLIVKEKIKEENQRIFETKNLKFEEKSQKLNEMENRRIEKKKEMKLKKQQEYEWNPYHNPFHDYTRNKISYNKTETIYPPIPKSTQPQLKGFSNSYQNKKKTQYLYQLDKKGLKYTVS